MKLHPLPHTPESLAQQAADIRAALAQMDAQGMPSRPFDRQSWADKRKKLWAKLGECEKGKAKE